MQALTDFIRAHQREILAAWEKTARRRLPAGNLDRTELIDHLPMVLNRLADNQDTDAELKPEARHAVGEHAQTRLYEGFELLDVVHEYSFLRDSIIGMWLSEGGTHDSALEAFNKLIDKAIADSVVRYIAERDRGLEALDRVSAAALAELDLDAFLARVLEVVRTTFQASTGAVLLRHDDTLRVCAAVGLEQGTKTESRLGEGFWGRIAEIREPMEIVDAAHDERIQGSPLAGGSVHRLYGVPLLDGSTVIGVAHMGSSDRASFGRAQKRLFGLLMERAALAIVHHRLRSAAEHRAAELEAVIAAIPDAIYVGNASVVTLTNKAALEQLGYEHASDLARSIADLRKEIRVRASDTGLPVPPEDLVYARALNGESARAEVLVRNRQTGRDVILRSTAAPIRLHGSIIGAVSVNTDITRDKANEAALRVSEERLRLALEAAQLGMWELDLTSQAIEWSPMQRRLSGVGPDFVPSLDAMAGLMFEDERRAATAILDNAAETGEGFTIDYRVLWPDRSVHWLSTRGRVVGAPNGGRRIMGVTQDITAIRLVNERQRLLVEAGSVLGGALGVNTVGVRLTDLVVPRLAEWCYVDLEDAAGLKPVAVRHANPEKQPLLDELHRIHPPDLRTSSPYGAEIKKGRAILYAHVSEAQLDIEARDARHRELLHAVGIRSVILAPLVTRGRVIGLLSIGAGITRPPFDAADLDITRELASRAALAMDNAHLYEEAQSAARAREDVLAIVSHDLRNPLSAIQISTTLLRETAPRGAARQIETIERSVSRMDRLMAAMLDMSAIEAGRLRLERARHPITALVRDALEMHDLAASQRGIVLSGEVHGREAYVLCDRERVAQVFSNLVGNSVKFTAGGGKVSVSARANARDVTFTISDTGRGIDPAQLPHVFERYYRANGEPGQRGSGLGLYIAKGIIDAHGGKIDLESEVGRGTVVTFTVPRG